MTLLLRTSWPTEGYKDILSETVAARLKTYGPTAPTDRDRIAGELRHELRELIESDRLEQLVDMLLQKCSHEFDT
jgi:hypothetical protein